jgi:hypothetical protein
MMITVLKRLIESLRWHVFMSRGAFLVEAVLKIRSDFTGYCKMDDFQFFIPAIQNIIPARAKREPESGKPTDMNGSHPLRR